MQVDQEAESQWEVEPGCNSEGHLTVTYFLQLSPTPEGSTTDLQTATPSGNQEFKQ